jgi:hypothetical protein
LDSASPAEYSSFVLRYSLLLLSIPPLLGCQQAVTDPLREGFPVDPAPVVGPWTTSLDGPTAGVGLTGAFDVLVERQAGHLSGFFEYALWGRRWTVRFQHATWDGDAISFVDKTDFGQQEADSLVFWTASYAPASDFPAGSRPSYLRLTAAFGTPPRCCVVDMSYYRPGQEPVPSDSLILIPLPGSRSIR